MVISGIGTYVHAYWHQISVRIHRDTGFVIREPNMVISGSGHMYMHIASNFSTNSIVIPIWDQSDLIW